ncbi:MAG TPA: hypothetical protein VFK51_01745 [Burkholderiales bacterium]|jgi:hypothetical protein|nr:hypothetical protein [Burkholderiales bacterium]
MALIVAGRFSNFEQANEAARHLHTHELAAEDVSVFYLNPPGQHDQFPIGGDEYADPGARPGSRGAWLGTLIGAIVGVIIGAILYWAAWRYWLVPVLGLLVGGYAGSLTGATSRMRTRREETRERNDPREAGVMIAARVDDEDEAKTVTRMLRERGAEDVEQASGIWKDGQWQDFDPRIPPDTKQASM